MHLLMGEVEVDQCAWDEATQTLSGTASRPTGERGNLFLHAPSNLSVSNPKGHWIAKDARDQSLIVRVALSFEDGSAAWRVGFASLAGDADMSKRDMA